MANGAPPTSLVVSATSFSLLMVWLGGCRRKIGKDFGGGGMYMKMIFCVILLNCGGWVVYIIALILV